MKPVLSMKKINFIQIVKIAIGSCISILIADFFHLSYSSSAGVITLLSIQNTKKETLNITLKRFLSFIISTTIAFLTFRFMGYHPFSYGFYLFLFVGICYLFNLEEGISMNAVLATHFLIEKSMSYQWIFNELYLLILGTGIGVLLNLYIPKKIMVIKQDQADIEGSIKEILVQMASSLLSPLQESESKDSIKVLNTRLKESLLRAYENMNNTLLGDARYYIQYMQMRKDQCNILIRIDSLIKTLNSVPIQAYTITDYMNHIASTFHENNNAIALLDELQKITMDFKNDPLPSDRLEFENRAILFQIINELELFLVSKRDFVAALTASQIKTFWNQSR